MPQRHIGFGGVVLGVVGTVAVLMLIPADADQAPQRQTALSTAPELTRFLDGAIDTRPSEKTSAQAIAEAAAAPEPGQPVRPVANVTIPAITQTANQPVAPAPEVAYADATGARQLLAARSAVNMRSGPSTSRPTLFVLKPDEEVAVLERQGGWAKVEKSNGSVGWVYASYLGDGGGVDETVTASIEPQESRKRRVKPVVQETRNEDRQSGPTLAAIRLRAAPSRGAETVFTVEPGTPLRIAERRNGWARVVVPGGMSGWVQVN